MLTIKRLVTLVLSFVLLLPVFILDTFIGCVLAQTGNALGLLLLASALVLAFLLSCCLAFSSALPWCREDRRSSKSLFGRICISVTLLAIILLVCLYSCITFLDAKPHQINLATIGMSKAQVLKAVGQPDWREGQLLWAYRVRGDGIAGILVPYYLTFDKNGLLVSIHS